MFAFLVQCCKKRYWLLGVRVLERLGWKFWDGNQEDGSVSIGTFAGKRGLDGTDRSLGSDGMEHDCHKVS
jgi:hypothetical protein